MASLKNVLSAASELGFEQSGNLAFGSWRGYAMSIFNNQGVVYLMSAAVSTGKKDKALRKTVNSAFRQNGIKNLSFYENNGDSILFSIKLKGSEPLGQQLRAYAEAITGTLNSLGIYPSDTCPFCGRGGCDSYCLAGTYQPVHYNCVRGLQAEASDEIMQNQQNGSYATGTLGAFLGALLGLLPSIILALAMDIISALAMALVPIASAWLYRKFNGKQEKPAIFIVIIFSLLSALLLQMLGIAYYMGDEIGISFGEAFSFVVTEGMDIVLENSLTSLFFMALGIVFAWRQIAVTNGGSLKNVDAVMSTVRPMYRQDEAYTGSQYGSPAVQEGTACDDSYRSV